MSTAATLTAPSARAWRNRVRRARRGHHERALGELLTNLYMLFWLVLVYGGTLAASVRRHLRNPGHTAFVGPETYWIGVAVLLVASGFAWQAARAVGPLMATPAEQTWGLATPVDRRSWLAPRFVALVSASTFGMAFLAAVVGFLVTQGTLPGWAALAGGVYAAAGVASMVAAQRSDGWRWPRYAGGVLTGAGALLTAVVVGAHYLGRPLPRPSLPAGPVLALAGVPLAIFAVARALRSLARLDLAALSAGAQLATATLSATVWLDPSLLTGVLEVRRWRQVGRVRSRPFRAGPGGRTWVLVQAEARRQLRRPGALGVWAGLVLAVYAVGTVAPATVGAARILLGYFAASRLMSGLRTLSSSAGLRRVLGGSEVEQRMAHLVVPALGTLVWWALTAPAGGVHLNVLELLLVAGVVGSAYRGSTRPPMSYGGAVFETPVGLFPMELIFQLTRGLDTLGAVLVVHIFAGG